MPKQTFFNLPEEKREKLIDVATDEFAKNSFNSASITKIVEKAGIAKGSLYQYFEDKKDLYKYILELSANKKKEYLIEWMNRLQHLSFIEMIRELYVKGVAFAADNPRLAGIANNFMKENDTKFKEEILGISIEKSNQLFEQLIENAKNKGEVSRNIDTKVAAFLVTNLNTSIVDYMLTYMTYEEIFQNKEELLDKVDKMLFIMENGFKAK
ncbi:MAG: TetR family transcriptional regulator [Clostridia bacterium]|jgi:AcrR family transcriptional regulator|nr:TetR family transcriptional regulator [Clostridia bacterium]